MMIHAKLLLRRLACVPWMLAVGLALVELTVTPVAALELTATPNVIREDAGQTEIALKVTLDNTPTANTEVLFTMVASPSGDSDFDEDTEVATRDVDYRAQVVPLSISAGQTVGMTTLTITPHDDNEESLAKVFTVTASVGGTRASTGIKITDDETPTTEVWLEVHPSDVYERAGETSVTVTGTLNGKVFKDNVVIALVINENFDINDDGSVNADDANATRDLDYTAVLSPLVIPGGSPKGATTVTIRATANDEKENDEHIHLESAWKPEAEGDDGDVEELDVVGATITLKDAVLAPPVPPDVNASFVLSASPSTVSEAMEEATIRVTATLDGGALSSDVTVNLSIDPASTAEEDEDYEWDIDDPLVIRAGSTSGSTEVFLELEDDGESEGNETIILNGSAGGASTVSSVEITLTDQSGQVVPPTSSTSITLSASPSTVSEEMEEATITVVATLDGGALSSDVTVNLSIDPASTAEEEEDYEWDIDDLLVIRAGSTSGSTEVFLELEDDGESEGRETIRLNGSATGLTVGSVNIILTDQATEPSDTGDSSLAFAAAAVIDDQTYTIDTAITPLVLPEAIGGTAPLTYTISSLPAGLVFDPATRTLSGTPSAATDGAVPVVYQATDANGQVAVLPFSITVNKQVSLQGIFSNLFGSGKIVPTDASDWATIREFVVGEYVDGLVLPEGTGGTAPLTYSLSPALPAGLTFDPATRTIAGTPQAASEAVYTYTVTDANGASASLALEVLPAAFSLADNFPNPFNPTTTIQYALPTATDVDLTVYNVVGQVVRTLVAEHQSAGRYTVEWDATDASGHSLSAGMYFYRLQAGGEFAEVKKMLLLK